MNGITGDPNEYDFGYDFNYALWTANTELTLANVPWDAQYRDVVRHESREKLNDFLDNQSTSRKLNSVYAKVDQPVDLDIPFNVAARFNYIRAFNPAQPIPGDDFRRDYYYFIMDVIYIAPNTTRLVLQLDVWSTYIHEIRLGRCFIEMGHIGIANRDAFRNHGRDFLTIPEGMDIGGEYVNVAARTKTLMTPIPFASSPSGTGYNVMVLSTVDMEADPGTKSDPNMPSSKGSMFHGLPSGASIYIFPTANAFRQFLLSNTDKPWRMGGIVSVTAIPDIRRYFPGMDTSVNGIGSYANIPVYAPVHYKHELFPNWRKSDELKNYIPQRYSSLDKLKVYPYTVLELTTWTGTPIILKPEVWNSDNADVREMVNLVPPGQRIAYTPMSYNSSVSPGEALNNGYNGDMGEWLDIATIIGNFPQFSIVNNGAIAALAANAHSIAYGFKSADWAQNKALRANQVGYDNAQAGINNSIAQTNIGIGADAAATGVANRLSQDQTRLAQLSGLLNGAGMGAMGGALAGGPVGAGVGALTGGVSSGLGALTQGISNDMSVNASNEQFAIRSSASIAAQDANAQYGWGVSDANKGLADWAAKGDYENQVGAMRAKIQDIAMTQPTTVGQVGGEAFNLVNYAMGITLRVKMIDQAAMSNIGEHWLRYGYQVGRNSFLPEDFAVMDRFTYWRLSETSIIAGRIPEKHKNTLRGIFEKGVTVYRNAGDIGIVDPAANKPLPNIILEQYTPPEITPPEEPAPEAPKRRRKRKMIVYTWNDGTQKYALAGASPGTPANWQETASAVTMNAWLDATGQTSPVPLAVADYNALKVSYQSPVKTVAG